MGQSDMGRCNALLLSGAGPISPDSDPESPPRAGATAQNLFPTFPFLPGIDTLFHFGSARTGEL